MKIVYIIKKTINYYLNNNYKMNINEVKKKLIDIINKKKLLVHYLKIGSDVEVLEIEEAIKSYDEKIKELKNIIEMNN